MNLIPAPYRLLAAALVAAAALAAAGAGGWKARAVIADRDIAALQTSHALMVAEQAQQAQAEEGAQRIEESRRTTAIAEVTNDSHKRTQARAVAVRTAAAAGDGLRFDAATFAAPASQTGIDSGATPGSAADIRAAVLSELLAGVEREGRDMARIADEARDAGHACQASYDALTEP